MGQEVEVSKTGGAARACFRVAGAALFMLLIAAFMVAVDIAAVPGIARDNPELAARVAAYLALAVMNMVAGASVILIAHEAAR